MFEDGLNSQEVSKINHLINRFNEMLESGQCSYFDSHEIEKIIDYFIENVNKSKLRKAFDLYEKLYPFVYSSFILAHCPLLIRTHFSLYLN